MQLKSLFYESTKVKNSGKLDVEIEKQLKFRFKKLKVSMFNHTLVPMQVLKEIEQTSLKY